MLPVTLRSTLSRSVINFREAYNMFACNGILFNHESPRRGETFVTRKVRFILPQIGVGQVANFDETVFRML